MLSLKIIEIKFGSVNYFTYLYSIESGVLIESGQGGQVSLSTKNDKDWKGFC